MDIPIPTGGDVDRATGMILACWICTAITGLCLVFRYAAKCWVTFRLSKVKSTDRLWGLEDGLFAAGWLLDAAHMAMLQLSYNAGFGRHFFFLTTSQFSEALRWQVAPQILIIASTTLSRTGLMWFLYKIFGKWNDKVRFFLIGIMILHLLINTTMMLEIVLQCGPNPYRPSNRLSYLHYAWEGPPEDGSVICQPGIVATSGVGFLSGAFNAFADFAIAFIATYEIWQYSIAMKRKPSPAQYHFREMNKSFTKRRLWQTATLSSPLILSGVASIIKTVMFGTMPRSMDVTWTLVPFTLWIKIEGYSILIASCAPIVRMFFNFEADERQDPVSPTIFSPHHILLGSVEHNTRNSGFDRMESTETFHAAPDGKSELGLEAQTGDTCMAESGSSAEPAGDVKLMHVMRNSLSGWRRKDSWGWYER
ncbi:hypothetical protein N431DRAFT_485976 [Stipitochalara longipes BDJ]|nr:hypothetical protein N431DRAFT_485976 [Stipitochalara longipes BDJ]